MLPDYLTPDLLVVFSGTSVATSSAARGHYYAGPGNKFYELLWEADLTGDRLISPEQDSLLPSYGVGLTDLVKRRASSSDAGLRSGDYDVPSFLRKIEQHRPFVVATNGREAAKRIARACGHGEPELGLASWKIAESHLYVLPSSSGSSADPKHCAPKSSKSEWWIEFGAWLKRTKSRSPLPSTAPNSVR